MARADEGRPKVDAENMSEQNPWELRKQGKVEEAFDQACGMLEDNPDNVQARSLAFWCLYDMAKRDLEAGGEDKALLDSCRTRLTSMLELYQDDDVMRSAFGWLAAMCANRAAKIQCLPVVAAVVKVYRTAFPDPTPQRYHSLLLRAVLSITPMPKWFGVFLRYWNLRNLTDEDYRNRETVDQPGKTVRARSLAAKAMAAASKHFESHPEEDSSWFDEVAPEVVARLEKDEWAAHRYAKYLLSRGRNEDALGPACEALYKTRGNAAAWLLLAKLFERMGLPEAAVACALQACSRDALICGRYTYQIVAQHLERNEDKAATKWKQLFAEFGLVWNAKTPEEKTEKQRRFAKQAREAVVNLVESSPPLSWEEFERTGQFRSVLAAVESVDDERNKMWLRLDGRQDSLQFKGDKVLFGQVKRSGPGTVIELLLSSSGERVFAGRIAGPGKRPECVAEWMGTVRLRAGQGFAFVESSGESALVAPNLVSEHSLTHGSQVRVLVVRSFDKKKNKQSWKVVRFLPLPE